MDLTFLKTSSPGTNFNHKFSLILNELKSIKFHQLKTDGILNNISIFMNVLNDKISQQGKNISALTPKSVGKFA